MPPKCQFFCPKVELSALLLTSHIGKLLPASTCDIVVVMRVASQTITLGEIFGYEVQHLPLLFCIQNSGFTTFICLPILYDICMSAKTPTKQGPATPPLHGWLGVTEDQPAQDPIRASWPASSASAPPGTSRPAHPAGPSPGPGGGTPAPLASQRRSLAPWPRGRGSGCASRPPGLPAGRPSGTNTG